MIFTAAASHGEPLRGGRSRRGGWRPRLFDRDGAERGKHTFQAPDEVGPTGRGATSTARSTQCRQPGRIGCSGTPPLSKATRWSMHHRVSASAAAGSMREPLPNVWLGVSSREPGARRASWHPHPAGHCPRGCGSSQAEPLARRDRPATPAYPRTAGEHGWMNAVGMPHGMGRRGVGRLTRSQLTRSARLGSDRLCAANRDRTHGRCTRTGRALSETSAPSRPPSSSSNGANSYSESPPEPGRTFGADSRDGTLCGCHRRYHGPRRECAREWRRHRCSASARQRAGRHLDGRTHDETAELSHEAAGGAVSGDQALAGRAGRHRQRLAGRWAAVEIAVRVGGQDLHDPRRPGRLERQRVREADRFPAGVRYRRPMSAPR